MQPLFSPVRLILSQLRRPWVVLVSGLVIAGLLAATAFSVLDHAQTRIRASEREIAGLAVVARIRTVLEPLQAHRGLGHAMVHGDDGMLLGQGGLSPARVTEAAAIRSDWQALRAAAAGKDHFARHGVLIDRLLALARRVIDDSGLVLDAEGGISHLINTLDVMLGLTLERAAQLRGLHTALLANGGVDPKARRELLACAIQLDDEHKLISHNIDAAVRYRPDLVRALGDLPTKLAATTRALRSTMRDTVAAPGSELAAGTFFEQASGAIREGYALFDRVLAVVDADLDARLVREKAERAWAAAGLLTLALALAYLFAGVLASLRAWCQASDALAQREALFKNVLDTVGAIVLVMDRDGRVVRFNRACEQVSGYRAEEVVGTPFWEKLIPEEDVARVRQVFQTLTAGHFPNRHENHWLTRDGGRRLIAWSNTCIADADGAVQHVIATGIDVTETRAAEAELRLAARVFEHAGEAIMVTDADNHIVKVNPAFTHITGYPPEEVLGDTPAKFKSGRHDAAFYQAMWQSLMETGAWEGEIWDRRRDGVVYPKWLTISAIRDREGEARHYVALFTDISERKRSEERIRHLAEHDALTGLPNRTLLQDRMLQAMARAERAHGRLALLYIDLDRFKLINDSLGHPVGDALLQEVAHRLLAMVRVSDTVSRLGGDEFLVLLADIEGAEDAARVAQKILDVLALPCPVGGHELRITPSIGISLYPDDSTDMDVLIKNADIAMYQAKESGRNTYQFHTGDLNTRAAERLELELGLRRALERGELLLHYQPQYELGSGRLVGLEALLRWQHPELGLIPPGRFIPIAEDSGLIVPIGEGVLHEACRQSLAWQAAGLPAVLIAVNLSAVQFRKAGLETLLRDILTATGLPPHLLELELTESIVMSQAEETVAILSRLHQLGVQLSIDDFGTGYSSLAYLKRFPIQKLKVDQSFVRDVVHDANDAAIVRGIVSLAHGLGLRVIAEGVETREQLEFLRGLGCEEAQGYWFSRPLPPAEIEPLLRAGRHDMGSL